MAPTIPLERVDGAIETAGLGAEPTRWSPFGVRLTAGGDPAALIATGRAAAQDEASQLATLALSQVPLTGPDHLWLDMCAGPGGKARLLNYLAAERDARLVAGELRPHRAKRVREAIQRAPQPPVAATTTTAATTSTTTTTATTTTATTTTATTATSAAAATSVAATAAAVVVADGRYIPWRAAAFDRVLADVPCSGLGSLRRRPEARWRKSPSDIPRLAALQRELLNSAIESVRPGGVVAYVTCSPHLAETYDVVNAVLRSRTDVSVLDAPAILAEAVPAGIPALPTPRDTRFAQFWPHRHGTDAIFLAMLRRE
jgi:16S rRNA (cytosine967-C5)-methyltransferase